MQFCNQCFVFLLTETDDKMRAFAESVFASETKGEDVRDEISMFDVPEDCPILQNEMAHHLHTEDNTEKRWEFTWLEFIRAKWLAITNIQIFWQ